MGNSVMLNGVEYAGEQIAYKDTGAALWKELRIHSAGIPNENSSVL